MGNLIKLMTNFSHIISCIQQSKNRAENVRDRLRECKNLLLLKRKDIHKLWLSILEQNALDRIYHNLNNVRNVPLRLRFYLSKRLYLHASLLLLKAKEQQELRLIGALSDIDLQIKEERLTLEDQLHSELIYQLFDQSCHDILENKTTTINRNDYKSLSRLRENRLLRKQLDQDFEEGKLSFESHLLSIIPDKYLLVDIRSRSIDLYFEVLLQSLSILSNLNKTIEFIQKHFYEQLHRMILRTTQHIVDNNLILLNDCNQTSVLNNSDCLRDLFEKSYDEFKLVVKNTEYVLHMLKLLQEHRAPMQIQQRKYLQHQKQRGLLF